MKDARDLALKYLNTRDRTAHEIRKHLESKGVPGDEISGCLEYLAESGMIDDEDYCERYISYGTEKGRGPLRLEKELLDKGLPREMVRAALNEHFGEGSEYEAALVYLKKLIKQQGFGDTGFAEYPEDGYFSQRGKDVARIGRRLASQGYNAAVIYELLDKLRDGTAFAEQN